MPEESASQTVETRKATGLRCQDADVLSHCWHLALSSVRDSTLTIPFVCCHCGKVMVRHRGPKVESCGPYLQACS